jgi:hypothetical protein
VSKPAEGVRREVLLPRAALEALADRVAGPWTDDKEQERPCPYCGHSSERPSRQKLIASSCVAGRPRLRAGAARDPDVDGVDHATRAGVWWPDPGGAVRVRAHTR